MRVQLKENYSPKEGVRFSTERYYEVRDVMLRSMNVYHQGTVWYNIPFGKIVGYGEDTDDCWTSVSREAGVDREETKAFLTEFMLDADSLPELAKAHALSAQNVARLIRAFNQWTGAEES